MGKKQSANIKGLIIMTIKKLSSEEQARLIQKLITSQDYARAKFIIRNIDYAPKIRKNIFQFYDKADIGNCARHIILNYEHPSYTFNKMREMIDNDNRTIKLLKSAVPHWRRVVNTAFRAYKQHNK